MSEPSTGKRVLRAALVLGAIAALSTALLAGMHAATEARVVAERERVERAALAALLPDGYDNDPLHDTIEIVAPAALGTETPVRVHRARRGGEPLGLVMAGEVDAAETVSEPVPAHGGERAVLAAPVEEVGLRDRLLRQPAGTIGVPDSQDPRRLAER